MIGPIDKVIIVMQTRKANNQHKTIYWMLLVFIAPLVLAIILQVFNYAGNLQNKGEWVKHSYPVNEIVHPLPHNSYSWSVLVPCGTQCDTKYLTQVQNGIGTLGTKANLVTIIPVTDNMIYQHHKSTILTTHLYLATPQKELILQYGKNQVMDLVMDLKKLLKTVEKRT